MTDFVLDRFQDRTNTREIVAMVIDGNLVIRSILIRTEQGVATRFNEDTAERFGITLCKYLEHCKRARELHHQAHRILGEPARPSKKRPVVVRGTN